MMVLNFKKRFGPDVKAGLKNNSFRVDRKDGKVWEPGDKVRLFTGMRTKQCEKLGDSIITHRFRLGFRECLGPQFTFMSADQFEECQNYHASLRKRYLPAWSGDVWAKSDGFESFAEWREFVKETHGLPADGWLYCWQPLNEVIDHE